MQKFLLCVIFILSLSWTALFAQPEITVSIPDITTCVDTVCVPVIIEDDITLTSLQFTINWDDSHLSFTDYGNIIFPDGVAFGPGDPPPALGGPSGDTLSFSWFTTASGFDLNAGDTLFTVYYDVLGGAGTSSNIVFINQPTPPQAFDDNFTMVTLNLVPGSVTREDDVFTITCPADITTDNDPGQCDAVVNYNLPTVTDCNNNFTLMGDADPGDVFPVGTTTVTYTASDPDGNSASCSFDITVNDTEDPLIMNCPADINVSVDANCEATATWTAPTVDDNCPNPTIMGDQTPGSMFPLGTTTVTYTAEDESGNTSTCTFNIVVTDDSDPTISCPSDTVINVGMGGAPVIVNDISPSNVDDNCGVDAVTYSLSGATTGSGTDDASGESFNEGTTTVTYTVEDVNGNTTSCSFTVTVNEVSSDEITIKASSEDVQCDDADGFTIAITIEDNVTLLSLQFTVMWDSSVIDFVATSNLNSQLMGGTSFGPGTVDDKLTFSWFGPPEATFMAGDTLFLIEFDVVGEAGESTQIMFPNSPTPPQASGPGFVPIDVNLMEGTVNIVDTQPPSIDCPSDVTVSNTPGLCTGIANFNDPVASDNCDDDLEITSNFSSGSPFPVGNTTVTFTATDDGGNSASCSFTVTVNDNEDPVITCPTDVTIDCDEDTSPSNTGNATATDNCDIDIDITFMDNTIDGACIGESTIERTFVATDDAGNSSSCVQLIELIDNASPIIICPADTVLDCDGDTDPSNTGFATATDDCDPDPSITFSDNVTDGACPANFTIERTWVAEDDCGNSSSCVQTISVEDMTAPVISGIDPDMTIECDSTPVFSTPIVTDNCDSEVDLTYVVITIAGSCPQEYIMMRTWTATDSCGNSSTATQSITLEDTTAPDITCPSDVTFNNLTGSCQGVATWSDPIVDDNCDPAPILSSTHVSGDTFPVGNTLVVYTATDGCGNETTCSFTVTIVEAEPPEVTCPSDITVETDPGVCTVEDPDLGDATATDNCGLDTITVIEPDPYVLGMNEVLHIATDDAGNSDTCTQIVTVIDNEDPTITCPMDLTIPNDPGLCSATNVSLDDPTVSDNCGVDSVFNDAPPFYNVDTTTVTFTVTDDSGNSSSCTMQVIVIDNESPTLICPADLTVTADTSGTATVNGIDANASDNCVLETLTYTLSGATTGSSPGTGINQASGEMFNVGVTTVTYTATDDSGNVSVCSFTVTVNPPSTITIECPDNVGVVNDSSLCGAVVNNIEVTITDSMNVDIDSIVYTFTGATTGSGMGDASGSTFNVGVTTVTYTVYPDPGDPVSCSFTISVADVEEPVITGCPMDIQMDVDINCNAIINWDPPQVTDNCPGVILTSTHTPGSNFDLGTTTVTYVATDGSGNSDTCSFTVQVEDDTPPTIDCVDDVVVAAPPGESDVQVVGIGPLNVGDNCGVESVTYTLTGSTVGMGFNDASGNFFNIGTTTVTYVVADSSGNTISCSLTVTVTGPDVPIILCPDNVTVSNDSSFCSAIVDSIELTILSDPNDLESITYTLDGATIGMDTLDASGTEFNLGTTNVTYTVIDSDGDTAMCTFTVTVRDTEFPVIENCPEDFTVDAISGTCEAIVDWDEPLITDNCPGVIISQTAEPGDTFPIGTSNVFYTGLDSAGQSRSCAFTITVEDIDPPIILNCPMDTILQFDSMANGAVYSWVEPTAVDSCLDVVLTSSHEPGDTFPTGLTVVTYIATDSDNNADTCMFNVIVVDSPIPELVGCPNDITLNNSRGNCFNRATWNGPFGINLTPGDTIISNFMSGDTFPVGITTVEYILFDDMGMNDTCTFTVTIFDNEPPVILNCPVDTIIGTNMNQCGASYIWDVPLVSDNCGVDTLISTHNPGDFFELGTTVVDYIVLDVHGNSDSCSFSVTVIDDRPPVFTFCPDDMTVGASDTICGAFVDFMEPEVNEECPGDTVVSNFVPGDFFPVGVTNVVYSAVDSAGNNAVCSFNITVVDTIGPVISGCPEDITITAEPGECQAAADWIEPTATDNCPGVIFASIYSPGDLFNIGTTPVIYVAVDAVGQRDSCVFNITVVDNDPPEITCPEDIILTVDGNVVSDPDNIITDTESNECESVVIFFNEPMGTDSCGGAMTMQTDSSGSGNGLAFPVGTTTLEYTVTDPSGNTATCSFNVIVNDIPPLDVTATPNPVCEGDSVQLFAGSVPDADYSWTGPGGFSSMQQNPVITDIDRSQEGVYMVTVTAENGCVYEGSILVDVVPIPDTDTLIVSNSPVCEGDDLFMQTIFIPNALYSWSGPDDFEEDIYNPVIFNVDDQNAGVYTVTITYNGCGSPLIASFTAEIIEDPPMPVANDDEFDVEFEMPLNNIPVTANDTIFAADSTITVLSTTMNGELSNNGDGTFNYIPDEDFAGMDAFTYEVCHFNECDIEFCDTATVTLNVNPDDEDCTVFNTITPNGDGVNDAVYVPCLDVNDPPENEIVIYNQWGDEVFRASPYLNDWEGTYEGEDLPDGTYYYIFRVPSRNVEDTGFITLFR